MKKQETNTQKEMASKLKLKAGIACLGLFALLIVVMLITSMNGILLSLAVVSHISGMYFLATSGYAKGNFCHNNCWSNWAHKYSKDPMDPRNPFYRSRHRLN